MARAAKTNKTAKPESSGGTQVDLWKDISERIAAELDKGGLPPWRKPWADGRMPPDGAMEPHNGHTGHYYTGINRFLLGMSPRLMETGDPRFYTWDQIQQHEARVNKGEKHTPVFWFSKVQVRDKTTGEIARDENGDAKTFGCLKKYTVWHASQISGLPAYETPSPVERPWKRVESVQEIADGMKVDILQSNNNRAFFDVKRDQIFIPPYTSFVGPNGWENEASVLLHELGHASGSATRLSREYGGQGTNLYAKEELVAEICSVFAGATLGIAPHDLQNHVSYLDSWAKQLRADPKFLFAAAAKAEKAAELLLSNVPSLAEEMARRKAATVKNYENLAARDNAGIAADSHADMAKSVHAVVSPEAPAAMEQAAAVAAPAAVEPPAAEEDPAAKRAEAEMAVRMEFGTDAVRAGRAAEAQALGHLGDAMRAQRTAVPLTDEDMADAEDLAARVNEALEGRTARGLAQSVHDRIDGENQISRMLLSAAAEAKLSGGVAFRRMAEQWSGSRHGAAEEAFRSAARLEACVGDPEQAEQWRREAEAERDACRSRLDAAASEQRRLLGIAEPQGTETERLADLGRKLSAMPSGIDWPALAERAEADNRRAERIEADGGMDRQAPLPVAPAHVAAAAGRAESQAAAA